MTKVQEDGVIEFKFFSKPMGNNLVIQKGTGLPKEIIFASLRQEVIRRMLNCSTRIHMEERMMVLENYIQLLVNSGHSYAFIKAILLQGLTKYKCMVQRSQLEVNHKKFKPLYRSRDYKECERTIVKYLESSTWFTGEKLGDMYKNEWKKRITRKNPGDRKQKGPVDQREITTVLFVPPSQDSKLLKMVREIEDLRCSELTWRVKIVEQPGIPLILSFGKSFPMEQGCPRGKECILCKNNGIGCTARSVVYTATCVTCKDGDVGKGVYVGETSRPVRERVHEHMTALKNWNARSFQIAHWMLEHYADTTPPKFKFKIVSAYQDPLRRQISEGLHILEKGTLNKRDEFNSNEICRMVSMVGSGWSDRDLKNELRDRQQFNKRLLEFINMKSKAVNLTRSQDQLTNTNESNAFLSCRNIQPRKRKLNMNTSTPMGPRREMEVVSPLNASPIEIERSGCSDSMEAPTLDQRTGISDNTEKLLITPERAESSSMMEKRLAKGGKDLNKAAEFAGIIKRSKSLPDVSCELHENTFYTFYKDRPNGALKILRSRSLGNMLQEDRDFLASKSLSPWNPSEDKMVEFIKGKLEEVNINAVTETGGAGTDKTGAVIIGAMANKSLLEELATPGGMGEKRQLKFSPDTPRGRFDKVSVAESQLPEEDGEKILSDSVVGGRTVRRFLVGKRLFQQSPTSTKTSPGVGERTKKKTPVLLKRKTRSKLTKLNIPPAGQPLITKAFAFGRKKIEGGREVQEQELDLGAVGGSGPFGEHDLRGPEREEREGQVRGIKDPSTEELDSS